MPSFTATPTLFVTQTSTGTISPTWTVSDTPQPSATAVVPLVLDRNIFRPESGLPLAINFKPESAGRVTVRIFNVAGESVRMPFQGDVAAGAWIQANWDGSNDFGEKVAAGIYVISVKGGGIKSLKKVVLLK
jgi:hypothetical protein